MSVEFVQSVPPVAKRKVEAGGSPAIAILLQCSTFEGFYGSVFNLDRDRYLAEYRSDYSWDFAKGLMAEGLRAIIYIPSMIYSGLYTTTDEFQVRFIRLENWYQIWTKNGWISKTPIGRYFAESANARAMIDDLVRSAIEDRISLVYVQEYWTGRFDYLVRRFPIPIMGADHGGTRRRQLTFRKRGSFRRAVAITCQSQDEIEQVRLFRGIGTFLPNGVDAEFFTPPTNESSRETFVLTVARINDRQKRTSDLIRAMAHVDPNWRLKIVGVGPDRAMLESLVGSLGLCDRVDFLGFRSRKELRMLYQTCGVFAMPSANEGMPLAALEAMSCGAAVVGSRIRAFEQLIEENVSGLLVDVGDISKLAAAVTRAAQEGVNLGSAARARIEEYFLAKSVYRHIAAVAKKADSKRQSR